MEKNIEIALIYDLYGKLLTLRQQEIFEEYYLYNLSLREIAENKKISYQAVRDSLKNSVAQLEAFDDKLHMSKILENVEKAYDICAQSVDLNIEKEKLIELLSIKSEDDI